MVIIQDRMLISSLSKWRYLVPHREPHLRLLPWADLQQTRMSLSSSSSISHPRPCWDAVLLADMPNVTGRQRGPSASASTEFWGSPYLQQSGFGLGNGVKYGERRSNFSCPFSTSQGKMSEIQRAWLKCLWVNTESTAGKHLPAQTWTCQSMTGRSPALRSCSSLNCLRFPECPSCKHLSKGAEWKS